MLNQFKALAFVIICVLKTLKCCHGKQYSSFCCNIFLVINTSILDSVKTLCFQQKNINTFDILAFIQMRSFKR